MNYYGRYYRSLMGGDRRKPRGQPVHQKLNVVLNLPWGVTYRRPHDNPAIGFMEGLQFLAGIFDLVQIARIAPHAKLELFTGQSAYGPRLGQQLHAVKSALEQDPDTRQAVIILAKPDEPLFERPCTTCLQFMTDEHGALGMTITLRSSDAVWGLPYDLIQCGIIQQVLAVTLRRAPGRVTVNAGNAHVYDATKVDGKWTAWDFSLPGEFHSILEWRDWARYYIKNSTATQLYQLFNFAEVPYESRIR